MRKLLILALGVVLSTSAFAAGQIEPTFKDVKYGPHERNTLNFWQVKSDKTLGILVHIHGGGWFGGEKAATQNKDVFKKAYHTASINYPLVKYGDNQPAMANGATRAIQFIRYKAKEWNIDTSRTLLTGGSAGGASSMWLGAHDDMADPESDDPIARQSTRVAGVSITGGQSTLDPFLIEERIGSETLKHNMLFKPFGVENIEELKKNWESKYKAFSNKYTALQHISKDDPPMFLRYKDAEFPAKDAGHGIHHGMFGIILKEKADKVGAKVYVQFKNRTPEVSQKDFMDSILIGKQ
ncbi:probable lipase/esterase [Lentisphaera araneosa HTCC2155]|uniref:Probable lipase/esterase n=1 Tax=Lentisphaera araneosa HTCC2155 TaxID=313628 RepID=A6DJJ0_9BACT|nr:alpha/beta hydrolase [Lentisphaera araneosa]EDM28064.1 probable lipase/esterase [Lentisphaera araneosa HTCC2155]